MQGVTYFSNYLSVQIWLYIQIYTVEGADSFPPQLFQYQSMQRATGRDKASLDRMAFDNLSWIDHLRVAHFFI